MIEINRIIKINSILLIVLIIFSMCSNVFAAEIRTSLEIIKQASQTTYLEDNQGYLENKIISSDSENGEIDIQINLNNVKTNTTEDEVYENTEIFILIPEYLASNEEKMNQHISYIETLATKVFAQNSKTKIGIIGIQGPIKDTAFDEEGNMVTEENDQGSVAGTAENAEIVVELTNNVLDLKQSLENMNENNTDYYTNLQAAVRLAINSYSEDVNKILISLFDNVPDTAVGVKNEVTYGGWFSEYATVEEAVIGKNEDLVRTTKSEILKLQQSNIDFILLRPDDTSFDQRWYNGNSGELELEFDGSSYVQELYGTLESPTYGKMYSLNNENLETIVTENIYNDIMEEVGTPMTSIQIKQYFTEEILENFDIIFPEEVINVDSTKLESDGYIIWDIGRLESNQSTSLKYTLKIKDMKNESLFNKTINTNEKIELVYTNYLDEEKTVEVTDSPKVKLVEIKEELIANVTYDPTTETTGSVTATIKTNKKVNNVEGWTLSEDKMTLTKTYYEDTTEIVNLVDEDDMTKSVEIRITNIIQKNTDNNIDDTTAKDILPDAGRNLTAILVIMAIILFSVILRRKYNSYKDIK